MGDFKKKQEKDFIEVKETVLFKDDVYIFAI